MKTEDPPLYARSANDLLASRRGAGQIRFPCKPRTGWTAAENGDPPSVPIGFIVVQIGNKELDRLCADAIVPALEACGLAARRVDKHNQGGLLKSEIVQFIQTADIIVADLTNERPNVYLEIGYAMGIDKFRNLILTVREDHFPDKPGYKAGGPKVHFDLSGYDILPWNPDDVATFRGELEKRIRRRIATTARAERTAVPVWDDEWLKQQWTAAREGLQAIGRTGFMELRAALHPPKISRTQAELNDAAREAPIRTFGWPIGVYLHGDEDRPRPRADGIVATIQSNFDGPAFDYWAIRRNGDLYLAKSLFEDKRRAGEIFFNTRIVRVTEAILYCLRLYGLLGVDRASRISLAVRHGGLKGRRLASSNPSRDLRVRASAEEDEVGTEIQGTLDEIEAALVSKVKEIVAPLFMLFDFFELTDPVYEEIVGRFLKGDVS